MDSKKLFALIAGCTIIFSVLFLINTKEMVYLEQSSRPQQPAAKSYSPSSTTFDTQAKPQYVKNLPTTINPALFAEVERRLMNCEYIYNKTAGPIFLSKLRGEWKLPLRDEWYMMMELIRCEAPFTFTRQSDGEFTIMTGKPIPNHTQAKILDRWEYAGGIGKLSVELQASMDNLPQNNGIIIHGVICPGNGWDHIHKYQINATQQNTRFITNTYVFAGCNYMLTARFMDEIVLTKLIKQPVIVIVNKECMAREKLILQWALDVYYLPDEFPTYYEQHGDMIMSTFASIAKAYTGVLFLMSGGPGMPPIQIAMSRANPWNQYVSFGSTLETWTKGYASRGAITGFDPECHLKEGTSCVFRKHPISGMPQSLDSYNEERKNLHLDTLNILNN